MRNDMSKELKYLTKTIKKVEKKLFSIREIKILMCPGILQNNNIKQDEDGIKIIFDYCDDFIQINIKVVESSVAINHSYKRIVDLKQEKVFYYFDNLEFTSDDIRLYLSYIIENYSPYYLNIICK